MPTGTGAPLMSGRRPFSKIVFLSLLAAFCLFQVSRGAPLPADPAEVQALKEKVARATRSGEPYLLDVETARRGPGAESTWYPSYSVAERSKG